MFRNWYKDGKACGFNSATKIGNVCTSRFFVSMGFYTGLSMDFVMPIIGANDTVVGVLATEQFFGADTIMSNLMSETMPQDSELALVQDQGV